MGAKRRIAGAIVLLFVIIPSLFANRILIYMDLSQTNHLRAYGVAYWELEQGYNVEWLLNYRGGSFLAPYSSQLEGLCRLRGISYDIVSESDVAGIHNTIQNNNMEVVLLEKAPRIAV